MSWHIDGLVTYAFRLPRSSFHAAPAGIPNIGPASRRHLHHDLHHYRSDRPSKPAVPTGGEPLWLAQSDGLPSEGAGASSAVGLECSSTDAPPPDFVRPLVGRVGALVVWWSGW
jgi:hypothetical protein